MKEEQLQTQQQKKRRNNPLITVNLILSVFTLLAVLGIVVLLLLPRGEEGFSLFKKKEEPSEVPVEITYTQAQVDEMVALSLEEGKTAKAADIKGYIRSEAEAQSPSLATILRTLYPENFVYPGDGKFYFVDIDNSYTRNPYKRENYVTDDNGYRFYRENEENKSVLCIDVSSHQGAIDWPKVASTGVKAAMVRAGYRGYGSGKMVEDEQAVGNLQGAQANGIRAGVYYFSQAINEAEVDEEVQVLVDLVKPYDVVGPLAIDVEKLDADTARGNTLSQEERTRLVKYFCEKVKEAGYEPMIYGNAYSLFTMLDYSQISEYPIWYAYYAENLYYPYKLTMWQYSNTGKVNGITGQVDLNVMYME